MSEDISPVLRRAWQQAEPTLTDDEIRSLVAVLAAGGGPVSRMVRAYRAGVRAATPTERPLSGFDARCPTCDSAHVGAVLWQQRPGRALRDGSSLPRESVMWARCYDDQTIYRPATGEVWSAPVDLLHPTTEESPDG